MIHSDYVYLYILNKEKYILLNKGKYILLNKGKYVLLNKGKYITMNNENIYKNIKQINTYRIKTEI